jgi:hypothetical protein
MKRVLQLIVLLLPLGVCAQDQPKEARGPVGPPSASTTHDQPQRTAYRVDIKLFEVDDGKRTNQREFSMVVAAQENGPPGILRVGNRVPVNTGEKGNYIDIGFEGRCRLRDMSGRLSASLDIDITGLAPSEEGGGTHGTTMPVLRSTRLNTESVLVPGKAQIVGSIDDLASKKRMQVEVIATKLD